MAASPEQEEYRYLVALLQRARVSLMGLMDAGTWPDPRGFRIDAEAALSEAHATIREIEEATDVQESTMPASRGKAQHVGCQKAVDTVKADLTAEIERLGAQVEMLRFCLDQARIVLEHFRTELSDPDQRRIAEGAMIASSPPGTLPGER